MTQIACQRCSRTVEYFEEFVSDDLSCPHCGEKLMSLRGGGHGQASPSLAVTARLPVPGLTAAPAVQSLTSEPMAPPGQLSSPGQIGLAAVLGGPLAGFLLMARNQSQRGDRGSWWGFVLAGCVVTAVVITLGIMLADSSRGSRFAVGIPCWILTYLIARVSQGTLYEQHRKLGGAQVSGGVVIGYVALGIVLTMVPACAGIGIYEVAWGDQELKVSAKEEIYYTRAVTDAEARTSGKVLQDQGFFNGIGEKSVRLSKDGTVYVLQVVLLFGHEDARTQEELRKLAESISTALGGKPVRIDLCDMWLTAKSKLPVVTGKPAQPPAAATPPEPKIEGPKVEEAKKEKDKE